MFSTEALNEPKPTAAVLKLVELLNEDLRIPWHGLLDTSGISLTQLRERQNLVLYRETRIGKYVAPCHDIRMVVHGQERWATKVNIHLLEHYSLKDSLESMQQSLCMLEYPN